MITSEKDPPKDIIEEEAGIFLSEEINEGEREATARNACSSESSGCEGDDTYQAIDDEYDYPVDNSAGYQGGFSGKSENLLDGSHFNVDGEQDMDIDEKIDGDRQIDLDIEDYII